jgi:hypothetical protein
LAIAGQSGHVSEKRPSMRFENFVKRVDIAFTQPLHKADFAVAA